MGTRNKLVRAGGRRRVRVLHARGVWFAAAALAGLGAGLYFGAARPGALAGPVRVSVAGAVRVTAAELVARANIAPGATLRELDRETLRAALRAHPWVRDASIVLLPPREVLFSVREREPRARVTVSTHGAGARAWLVDAEGVLIAPAQTRAEHALPELRGLNIVAAAQANAHETRAQAESARELSEKTASARTASGRELDAQLAGERVTGARVEDVSGRGLSEQIAGARKTSGREVEAQLAAERATSGSEPDAQLAGERVTAARAEGVNGRGVDVLKEDGRGGNVVGARNGRGALDVGGVKKDDFGALPLAELVGVAPARFLLREFAGAAAPQPLRALVVRSVGLLDAVQAHALPTPVAVVLGGRAVSELPALVFAPRAARAVGVGDGHGRDGDGGHGDGDGRNGDGDGGGRDGDGHGDGRDGDGDANEVDDAVARAVGAFAGRDGDGAAVNARAGDADFFSAVTLPLERTVLLGDGEAPWQLARLVRLSRAGLPAYARAPLVDLRFGEQVILRAR